MRKALLFLFITLLLVHVWIWSVYYILEGKGQMMVDGEPIAVGPGATVVTPASSTRGLAAETQLSFLATRVVS